MSVYCTGTEKGSQQCKILWTICVLKYIHLNIKKDLININTKNCLKKFQVYLLIVTSFFSSEMNPKPMQILWLTLPFILDEKQLKLN